MASLTALNNMLAVVIGIADPTGGKTAPRLRKRPLQTHMILMPAEQRGKKPGAGKKSEGTAGWPPQFWRPYSAREAQVKQEASAPIRDFATAVRPVLFYTVIEEFRFATHGGTAFVVILHKATKCR